MALGISSVLIMSQTLEMCCLFTPAAQAATSLGNPDRRHFVAFSLPDLVASVSWSCRDPIPKKWSNGWFCLDRSLLTSARGPGYRDGRLGSIEIINSIKSIAVHVLYRCLCSLEWWTEYLNFEAELGLLQNIGHMLSDLECHGSKWAANLQQLYFILTILVYSPWL